MVSLDSSTGVLTPKLQVISSQRLFLAKVSGFSVDKDLGVNLWTFRVPHASFVHLDLRMGRQQKPRWSRIPNASDRTAAAWNSSQPGAPIFSSVLSA